MSLTVPLNHSCHIKCPNCNHKYLYEFKINELHKVNSSKMENCTEIKYTFSSYLTCKNPLCHYDMEIMANVIECPLGKLTDIDIINIK